MGSRRISTSVQRTPALKARAENLATASLPASVDASRCVSCPQKSALLDAEDALTKGGLPSDAELSVKVRHVHEIDAQEVVGWSTTSRVAPDRSR